MKKSILFILLLITIITAQNFYPNLFIKDIFNKYFYTKQNNYIYKHELAVLNKSYYKDLDRTINLYKSFEKYFLNASSIPFFIVAPEKELEIFKNKFLLLKKNKLINNLPYFLSEEEILNKCNEPNITHNGGWTQQVVKLCFGMTNLARNYIVLDSDTYFTQHFNPKILFRKNNLKTFAWKLSPEIIEKYKTYIIPWFLDCKLAKEELTTTSYKNMTLIKDFFGNKNLNYYGFVGGTNYIDSNRIHRMHDLIDKKGGYKFSMLIRIVPYEMQWYGEYVLQHEKFIPKDGLFLLVNSPDDCLPESAGDYYGTYFYGIWFQSFIYDYTALTKDAFVNENIVYKRPANCK